MRAMMHVGVGFGICMLAFMIFMRILTANNLVSGAEINRIINDDPRYLLVMSLAAIGSVVFMITSAVHAFKLQKGRWFLAILLLNIPAAILYYWLVFRPAEARVRIENGGVTSS